MSKHALLELDPNETIIVEIKRHPIVMVGIFVATVIGVAISLLLLFISVRSSDTLGLEVGESMYALLFGGLAALIVLFGYIASVVSKANELVVTNENIIQVLQFSLFSNQTSQLNLAKIQDVSVDTNGILASIFNFGTIDIETAGEASNFRFRYAPNPNKVAKLIIEAHEAYVPLSQMKSHV